MKGIILIIARKKIVPTMFGCLMGKCHVIAWTVSSRTHISEQYHFVTTQNCWCNCVKLFMQLRETVHATAWNCSCNCMKLFMQLRETLMRLCETVHAPAWNCSCNCVKLFIRLREAVHHLTLCAWVWKEHKNTWIVSYFTTLIPYCLHRISLAILGTSMSVLLKVIVSRDFVVFFCMSFDRSEVPTHEERVHLLLKLRFRVECFDFRV
jgi:hypothetical protein